MIRGDQAWLKPLAYRLSTVGSSLQREVQGLNSEVDALAPVSSLPAGSSDDAPHAQLPRSRQQEMGSLRLGNVRASAFASSRHAVYVMGRPVLVLLKI